MGLLFRRSVRIDGSAGQKAGYAVLEEVGDHAGAQTASPVGEQAEHDAEDGDEEHGFPALIAVTGAESDALQDDSSCGGSREDGKLALQVASKNELFTKARGKSQEQVDRYFDRAARKHVASGLIGGGFEQVRQAVENESGDEEKDERDADVAKNSGGPRPSAANEFRDAQAATAETVPNEARHGPFENDADGVADQALVSIDSGQLRCAGADNRNRQQSRDDNHGVPGGRDGPIRGAGDGLYRGHG